MAFARVTALTGNWASELTQIGNHTLVSQTVRRVPPVQRSIAPRRSAGLARTSRLGGRKTPRQVRLDPR
ncbi:MAG: hypothetical protein ACREOS_06060, partial [Candidatus Dormibacteraceae bacterium]